MKRLLSLFTIPLSVLAVIPLAHAGNTHPPVSLQATGVLVDVRDWNDIRIEDGNGATLATLTGVHLKWKPDLQPVGGKVTAEENDAGQPFIRVDYDFAPIGDAPSIGATLRLSASADQVDVRCEVFNLPADANVGGTMLTYRLPKDATFLASEKMGLWQRHAAGGLPQEHPDGKMNFYRVGDRILAFAFDGSSAVNLGWKDPRAQHIGLKKDAQKSGTYTGQFSILIAPAAWPAQAVAAGWHGRPVGLSLQTDKVYNWWESVAGAPAAEQPELDLQWSLVNTSGDSGEFVVSHWVRDFAGNIISEGREIVPMKESEVIEGNILFRPSDASVDASREIFFAEVLVTAPDSGEELAFARTNLALVPPHQFKSTDEDSIFGMAAYWPFPDEASVQGLMERMGVRWLRHGNSHDYKNITAILHNQVPKASYDADPAAGDKWIREQLQRCVDQGNPAWEFGNEINYSVMSIGMGDIVRDEERERRINHYLEWVKAIRRVQEQMGPPASDVKLLSVGLAGMDVVFADTIEQKGGWEFLDGLALHPGRGNYTPDYPIDKPWQDWQAGAFGSYWNFYGSITTASNLVKKYGSPGAPKELWLTEVYACSFPNSFWEDSLRHAPENAVLSFALGMSVHVKSLMWYQLSDGVWYDKDGVNPKDREYYFGLLNRDLSFKPAVLGYMAVAEALDQATFKRWISFPQSPTSRGLLFDTPRGPLVILWDRTDGFFLSEKKENFASTEAWVQKWQSEVNLSLPVSQETKELVVINAIGQKTVIKPTQGAELEADITLTGAPVMVYGIDVNKLR